MTHRDWDAELAKIDRQLASVSDEALLAQRTAASRAPAAATTRPGADPRAATPAATGRAAAGGRWRGWMRTLVAAVAAAGLWFWPWPAACGAPLVGFNVATGVVALLGAWSAVGTWRHRLGLAHVVSLLVTLWALVLGAREVLPRVGYAIPTAQRGPAWQCDVPLPSGPLSPT